jgi:hypothetical protein
MLALPQLDEIDSGSLFGSVQKAALAARVQLLKIMLKGKSHTIVTGKIGFWRAP